MSLYVQNILKITQNSQKTSFEFFFMRKRFKRKPMIYKDQGT